MAGGGGAGGRWVAGRCGEAKMLMGRLRRQVDEAVLSCLFAYMKKAGEDGLDGMVSIFQTMLQEWAAVELIEAKPNNAVLEKMLDQGADSWNSILKASLTNKEDKDALLSAVQSCVEKVVLQKASGSYGQRVQAEFLREIMTRIRDVPDASPASSP
jgi:hypothetical protein